MFGDGSLRLLVGLRSSFVQRVEGLFVFGITSTHRGRGRTILIFFKLSSRWAELSLICKSFLNLMPDLPTQAATAGQTYELKSLTHAGHSIALIAVRQVDTFSAVSIF